MKVMLDTNVLISAVLQPSGKPYAAYRKAILPPNQTYICVQVLDELRLIFNKKFPNHIEAFEKFLSIALESIEVVTIPESEIADELKIRDKKDRPIMRAAISANVDILLTGDKDFLESGIKRPEILTPAEFLKMY